MGTYSHTSLLIALSILENIDLINKKYLKPYGLESV